MSVRAVGTAVALVGLLAGCGEPGPGSPVAEIAEVADAGQDEQIVLFSSSDVAEPMENFAVLGAAALPDGRLFVSWDPNSPAGGDDREPFSDPRLSILGADGALLEVALPSLDGTAVDPAAALLGGGPDGTVFLADWAGRRVVARSAGGQWRSLTSFDALVREPAEPGEPTAASPPEPAGPASVAPDGSLYLVGDGALFRVTPDGVVSRVVDVQNAISGTEPPVPRELLPRPATGLTVPTPWGLAVDGVGTVFLNTGNEILSIEGDGVVRLVITVPDLLARLGVPDADGDGNRPLPGALGLDLDGALLVSDFGQGRLVRLAEGLPTVLGRGLTLSANGVNAAFSPHGDLLVRPTQWDQLATFGR